MHAALALDRLHQHRHHARRLHRREQRGAVIERDMLKARHRRLETLFHLLLPGRGDPRERPPVE